MSELGIPTPVLDLLRQKASRIMDAVEAKCRGGHRRHHVPPMEVAAMQQFLETHMERSRPFDLGLYNDMSSSRAVVTRGIIENEEFLVALLRIVPLGEIQASLSVDILWGLLQAGCMDRFDHDDSIWEDIDSKNSTQQRWWCDRQINKNVRAAKPRASFEEKRC